MDAYDSRREMGSVLKYDWPTVLGNSHRDSVISWSTKFLRMKLTDFYFDEDIRPKKHRRPDFMDFFLIFLALCAASLFIIALQQAGIHFFTPKAEASVETYDNAWYCTHIDEYFVPERSTVDDYCADHPELALGV